MIPGPVGGRQAEPEANTCPIAPTCGLKGALHRALRAFLGVLDEYSLDQILTTRSDLVTLLDESLLRAAKSSDAAGG